MSTLAALHAGLRASATLLSATDADFVTAVRTADQIESFALERGIHDGHFVKEVDGDDAVDAVCCGRACHFVSTHLCRRVILL